MGLSLAEVADAIGGSGEGRTLTTHLDWLRRERTRLGRQIKAVTHAIAVLEQGEELVPEKLFDGFDHTQYKEEVEERWGAQAYARSDRWWRGLEPQDKAAWKAELDKLNSDWVKLAAMSDADPAGPRAQELARRHVAWLASIPGTPAADTGGDLEGYVRGLANLYVEDSRFAANYGGPGGAAFVRDALLHYLETR
jgi:hypothetical protein